MYLFLRRGALLTASLLSFTLAAEQITTTLELKPKVSMEQLAQNVQNPASAHFNRFYEPSEIRALAAPSDQQYSELLSGLVAEGFTIVKESPTHLWVSVRGEKAIYESLFATQIQSLGGGVHRNQRALLIPFHLNLVESVSGLDNTRQSHPRYKVANQLKTLSQNDGLSPATIKTAYGFDPIYTVGLTGKGQHIAIATYNGFLVKNVQQYYKAIGLTTIPTVDQVAFNGSAPYDENSAGETELDSEFSGMIAPGANIHVFASAANSDDGELQMFTAILDDNRAKIVNYSWGSCETQLTAQHKTDMEKVFARAVAQGVNILVASGDSGSDSCGDNTNAADWPAASPYVVAVGGTTVSSTSGGLSETGWSGSGGGISALWTLPIWQQALGGIYVKRSYPDVSFNADPVSGQSIYTGAAGSATWMVVGGTSMAAPQWAGFLALVAEARQVNGKADVGFLAPTFYAMKPEDRAATFHDVTAGNNGLYKAGAGWDAVTGWGSMQADALLNYIKAL